MFKYVFLCAAVIVGSWNVAALTKDELAKIHESALPGIVECSKEFGIADEAIENAKKEKKTDGLDSCFLACVFKKSGFMDENNKVDTAKALEKTKEFVSNEDDIKKASEILEKCSAVNEKAEGCEVAKLFMDCLGEYKEMFAPTD